jgi:hypothetical protein
MENAPADDIITRICTTGQPLQPYQRENIAKILSISKEFGNAAHLPLPYQSFFSREPDVIIESGHQPNFLPYTGIMKKVFLLHWIARQLSDKGSHPIALFGFADQNLSTASYLHENIIPAVNKSGYEKIGFRIREKDRWKCFDAIEKPSHELWQKEIEKFRRIYQQGRSDSKDTAEMRIRADRIIELMESSYELANNFADLNAYFFSKLCIEVFGLEVYFFRYSDIQKNSIFAEEWKELMSRNAEYIASYNAAITNHALPLHSLMKDHVPFWYHCECGGNVSLTNSPGAVKGTCPSCGKEHILSLGRDYQNLGSLLPRMSLTAVARNLVFAKGLGTRIFISGAGGGLQYGRIANAVSYSLKFPVPVTLAWASRDFYLGQTHSAALIAFLKLFKITREDLIQSTAIRKIHDYRNILKENIQQNVTCMADKKTLQKYQGQYNNSTIQLEIIQNIFSVTPSMLDVIINVSPHTMSEAWVKSVEHAPLLGEKESWEIRKDTTYSTHNLLNIHENDIPLIYRNISVIEVNQP